MMNQQEKAMRSQFFIGLLAGLIGAFQVCAESVVIYDSGNTQPLPSPREPVRIQLPSTAEAGRPSPLPVRTPEMSPGRVSMRKINRPALIHPVFIVGADPLSKKWLVLHRQTLKTLNATGIAVNVETDQELDQLIEAAGGLTITPVPGSAIARQLRLNHYPALVSKTRIEQ